jgi:hypothetical protein
MFPEPTIRNLSKEELLHYASIEGDPVAKRIAELVSEEEFAFKSDLELECEELQRAVDDLTDEYDTLEAVADEAHEKIMNYIGELEDLLHSDEDQLRTNLMAYIDKLVG